MLRDLDALLRLIEARQTRPFAWRQPDDCVSFAVLAIRAQFGWNPLERLRWSSKRGAARVLKRLGGLEAAADARLIKIAPARAMRGDIAGVADPLFGVRLMVVEGDTLVGPGDRGLRRMPRSTMIRAWSAERPDV